MVEDALKMTSQLLATLAVVAVFLVGGVQISSSTTLEPTTQTVFQLEPSADTAIPIPTHRYHHLQVQPTELGVLESNQQVDATRTAILSQLSSKAVYIFDEESNSVLLDKNAHLRFAPASTTKLLTALVALETFSLSDQLTVPADFLVEGTQAGLLPGEVYTVEDLLSVMLVSSANDAAELLALSHPQGKTAFLKSMNEKAQSLGMKDSFFATATGLDDSAQYTTAHDLTLLAETAFRTAPISRLSGQESMELWPVGATQSKGTFVTTHQLIAAQVPQVLRGKTGTTEGAGQVLITQVNSNSHSCIIVVMGSSDRYPETARLLEWMSANYTWVAWQELVLDE